MRRLARSCTLAGLSSIVSLAWLAQPIAAQSTPSAATLAARPILSSVRVEATATDVRLFFPTAVGIVHDSIDAATQTVFLTMNGVRAPGVAAAPLRRAGIISVGIRANADSDAVVAIALTGIRSYRLSPDPTGLRLYIDGTGEEMAALDIPFVPRPVIIDIPMLGVAKSGGARDLTEEDGTTIDQRTRDRLKAWEEAKPERITVTWDHVPLRDALALFGRLTNHSVVPGVGLDTVTVSGDYRNATWANALKSLARIYALRLRIGDGDILSVEQSSAIAKADETTPLEMRVFQLGYTTNIEELAAALQKHATKRGAITSLPQRRALIVNDVPDAVDRISTLLRVLDRPVRQVRISYMVVSVDRSIAKDLGFIYDAANRTGGNSLGAIPIPGATGGAGATGAAGAAGAASGPPTGPMSGDPNFFNVGRGSASGALGMPLPSIAGASLRALFTGTLGSQSIVGLMEALESHNQAKVVARQSLVVEDGKEASGNSGEETPLRVQGVTGGGGGGGQSGGGGQQGGGGGGGSGGGGGAGVPLNAVERVSTGIKLIATPRIEPDDVIALDVKLERSSAVPSGIGDAGVQFLRNTYSTYLRARNGETVVVGGLKDRVESESVTGVPVLMHIPFLGRLFKSTKKTGTERDLLLLVTVNIENRQ